MDQGVDPIECRCRIALHGLRGLGPARYYAIINRFGSAAAALAAGSNAWQAAGIPPQVIAVAGSPDWSLVDRVCQWMEQPDCALLCHDDPGYPRLLREIVDPPPLLYVRGGVAELNRSQIAIIGSRQATNAGRRHAELLAGELAEAGLAITSGLALGIDAAAHRGALARGGKTIAVFGSGIDTVYPYSHRGLAREIANQGALVSEFPLRSAPVAAHFPQRNRVISGLSLGTVVIEARRRSGSLITVRHALAQGREVFAVPGSIDSPLAAGANELIKQGAKLVSDVTDILEEFAQYKFTIPTGSLHADRSVRSDRSVLAPADRELLGLVASGPTSLDDLVQRSGLTASTVSSMLLRLELAGLIALDAGGLYSSECD